MISAADLARSFGERYRQLRGVPRFGIESVPAERKTVEWLDLFGITFSFLVNSGRPASRSLGLYR